MPDDKVSKSSPQLQKKKKKKKKKQIAGSTSPGDADQPRPAASASAPPVLPAVCPPRPSLPKLKSPTKKKSDSEKCVRKSKKSTASLLGLLSQCGTSPVQSFLSRLSDQARESVRWEGALDDPLDEEQRLELYRANRRLRYIRHREAQLRETQQEDESDSSTECVGAPSTLPLFP